MESRIEDKVKIELGRIWKLYRLSEHDYQAEQSLSWNIINFCSEMKCVFCSYWYCIVPLLMRTKTIAVVAILDYSGY